jgi:ornithine--oxo-acid transaminase
MGPFCEYFCNLIGYEKFLPSSGGVEACESACKLARRWGYVVKGIEDNKANILMAKKCFWGRSITAASGCDDPLRMKHFGPFTPGFPLVDYDDVEAIENYLKNDPNCAGVMLESIQGEAGVIIPQNGYLAKVKALCVKYNVLLLVDEVQTGLGRTGKLMDYMYDMGDDKPDIVTFGKSISGGVTPVSGICADAHLMDLINPGEHGSTFGGMPIAMAVSHAACKAIVEEGMVENSHKVGEYVRKSFRNLNSPHIKEVRGRGMLNAMEFHEGKAPQFVDCLREHGLIVRPSGAHCVKFTPALIMTEEIVDQSMHIFEKALAETF